MHALCWDMHGGDVSAIPVQLLWKYSKGMVELRLRFLQQNDGTEPRTVLVQDIPGQPSVLIACPDAAAHEAWTDALVPYPECFNLERGTLEELNCVHPARPLTRSFCCCAGIYYGTMLQRLDAFVLRWLPKAVKEPLKRTVSSAVNIGHKGLQATAGRVTDSLVGRHVLIHWRPH